ncbi:hypothetical protein [Enterococcus mundtii]|uniref:hypothetical protein n=1 Tax=Enterococcus mundtii TaxID=53346 RepID=UPI001159AB4B|nr:hypothetical protein [Enterococcus mundtii]
MGNSIQKLAGISAMLFSVVLLVGRLFQVISDGQTNSTISILLNGMNFIVLFMVIYAWHKIKQQKKSATPHFITLIGLGIAQSVIIINQVNIVTNYAGIFLLLVGVFLVYSSGIVYLVKR